MTDLLNYLLKNPILIRGWIIYSDLPYYSSRYNRGLDNHHYRGGVRDNMPDKARPFLIQKIS